ncbi:hypothetical protein QBC40DRAFT_299004 [Triangularia verruculosa]|uniref:Uncharacterized protein n=1 Tax=Triangularia verruculosa TaxID=2587418 RepID=A0AAN6XCH4_9PEZI|nr:hypothetical protein QBC40DRAFT_299004 [Triangularia verruculosa]
MPWMNVLSGKPLTKHMRTIAEVPSVHLLTLSRPERDIELGLQNISTRVRLEGANVDAGIALSIGHRMESSEHGARAFKQRFRWVQFQLDALEIRTSSNDIDDVLSSLPQDLPATYERKQDLKVGQFSDVLLINPNGSPRIRNVGIYWNRLLTACSSLVSLSPPSHSADIGKVRWYQKFRTPTAMDAVEWLMIGCSKGTDMSTDLVFLRESLRKVMTSRMEATVRRGPVSRFR